ncbi:MAG: hypothetical protein HOP30_09170 [Cyclobacteriaceae bacterium]|nr:hypothetical protein [Cyclobacteriaceae bacterium]
MKIQTIIAAGLAVVASTAFSAQAQSELSPSIKVLPSTEEGVVKILYAYETNKPVEVRFSNESGILKTDRVKPTSFAHGFIKKYDVSGIDTKKFKVEVISENVSVTYVITESKTSKGYTPRLESTTYNQPLVASNN